MGLVAVNGSPSDTSKTHAVAAAAVELAGGGSVINVGDLDADALVLRGQHASVSDALEQVAASQPLVLVTPVYRATYSGLLTLILDFSEDGSPLPSVLDPLRRALDEAALIV